MVRVSPVRRVRRSVPSRSSAHRGQGRRIATSSRSTSRAGAAPTLGPPRVGGGAGGAGAAARAPTQTTSVARSQTTVARLEARQKQAARRAPNRGRRSLRKRVRSRQAKGSSATRARGDVGRPSWTGRSSRTARRRSTAVGRPNAAGAGAARAPASCAPKPRERGSGACVAPARPLRTRISGAMGIHMAPSSGRARSGGSPGATRTRGRSNRCPSPSTSTSGHFDCHMPIAAAAVFF
mmetsp:Transcript_18275/g.42708  ORF Transcript_18275/g.42708 Transcript_18275/m.42708 type:complete len:237 (-) Transcript_18275:90-800(-)